MPDITMCTGRNGAIVCPLRTQCYRYMAKPNPWWQSFMNAPIAHEDQVCESYWADRTSENESGERNGM